MTGPGDQGFLGTTPLSQRSRNEVAPLEGGLTLFRGHAGSAERTSESCYSFAAGVSAWTCSSLPCLAVLPVIRCQ